MNGVLPNTLFYSPHHVQRFFANSSILINPQIYGDGPAIVHTGLDV